MLSVRQLNTQVSDHDILNHSIQEHIKESLKNIFGVGHDDGTDYNLSLCTIQQLFIVHDDIVDDGENYKGREWTYHLQDGLLTIQTLH